MNYTRLWNAKLTWYFQSAFYWIGFYGLKCSLMIHSFRPTWTCLIIKTWAEFLVYCTVITFYTTNILSCFCSMMVHFKLVKYKFPNWIMLQVHLCNFQIKWTEVMHDESGHQLLPTTTVTYYGLNCFGQWYICHKLVHTKILQNFWLTFVLSFSFFFFNKIFSIWKKYFS